MDFLSQILLQRMAVDGVENLVELGRFFELRPEGFSGLLIQGISIAATRVFASEMAAFTAGSSRVRARLKASRFACRSTISRRADSSRS